ncbi:MAG: molybdopterin molybdotransferase MoeA [Syntrophorhabdus sp.]|nr:molybdopterin molybdotransferase MoeA [Syntrophorhabdus sp.]
MKSANLTVSVEEALRIVLDSVRPLGSERISIMEASNRVLYDDVVADTNVPPLDDSGMDGYAIIAADTLGASKDHPARLQVVGEVQAGASGESKEVTKGSAIRIMTGAPIPKGADSVIQVEDTKEEGGYVRVFRETAPSENIRFTGESIATGDIILRKGDRLSSAKVGILASLNHNAVFVYRQPTVSIISTGNELADIGEDMRFGQIRNVNAYTLHAEVGKYGGLPHYLGIVKDTMADTREIFLKALESDVVISTGGVSMGKYDFVKDIFADLGIDILFEWVKVKPGRPCTFGKKGDRLIFGLPGNPVSTMTSFIQFVRPALLKLMGATRINKPVVNAVLDEGIEKPAGKVFLLRGHFTIRPDDLHVVTTGNQKSSVLRSMSEANCLIVIPEHTTRVKAGERVAIQLIDHDEL